MSVSVSPSARMLALTRADPPLVEPPSQTSSWFAAVESEFTSTGGANGRAGCPAPVYRGERARPRPRSPPERGSCGKPCLRVPGGADAVAKILDEDRASARKGTREGTDRACESGVLVAGERRGPRRGRARQAVHRADDRRRAAAAAVDSGHRQSDVAPRQRNSEIEPVSAHGFLGPQTFIDADENSPRSRSDAADQAAEGDLVRTRDDERGRGGRRRRRERRRHTRMIAHPSARAEGSTLRKPGDARR